MVKVVILAVAKEELGEDEEFSAFIKRIREKYAKKFGSNDILLKVV
jgi:hypothetical protein